MIAERADGKLDVGQAALLTGRSAETVRRWIWSGDLPAFREGRRLLIARSDLDQWLARRAGAPTMTLSQWAATLEATSISGERPEAGATASDLVLDDRRRRSIDGASVARR